MSEIGIGLVNAANNVYNELLPLCKLEFDAGEPVHRIDDFGNYVSVSETMYPNTIGRKYGASIQACWRKYMSCLGNTETP